MSQKVIQLLTLALAMAAILIALVNVPSANARPPLGISNMDSLHLSDWNGTAVPNFVANQRGSGVIAEFRDAGTPVVQIPNGGGLTINSGGLTITDGDVAVPDWLNIAAQSVISLANGVPITPTGTYQLIQSGAEITTSATTSIISGTTAGDLLILRNTNASDIINIDGAGANVACKANVALGASDTLTLVWNGVDWNCLSSYDNS